MLEKKEIKTAKELHYRVKELLSGEDKWCKFKYKDGDRMCLMNACWYDYKNTQGCYHVYNYIKLLEDRLDRKIVEFNDAPETEYVHIKNLLDDLDEEYK